VRLSGLHVFPIKSCRGIAVSQAEVTRRGLARDRRWMIVDEGGAFMTQRDYPDMTHVRTALDGETLVLNTAIAASSGCRCRSTRGCGATCRCGRAAWRRWCTTPAARG
jgi:uncharacterized protein YcbX